MAIFTSPKRVKRIASKNKSDLLGSEFSFEDFSFQEVENTNTNT